MCVLQTGVYRLNFVEVYVALEDEEYYGKERWCDQVGRENAYLSEKMANS